MPSLKRNEWLDADASDEDNIGYESEEFENSRGQALSGHAHKRRKLSSGSEDEPADTKRRSNSPGKRTSDSSFYTAPTGSVQDERFNADDFDDDLGEGNLQTQDLVEDDDSFPGGTAHVQPIKNASLPLIPKELSSKHLSMTAKSAKKSGVIYLSRIPPFMKPSALRSLLTPYAPHGLNRIFLTPESPEAYSRRKRGGGNKKRSFVDGWVEFLSKREAKACVELLNGQIVGGKKGGWYHDDVWSMKYLKTFKWSDLVEAISNENAERNARMRAEIAQSTRANREFVDNVEKAKMMEGIERKREEAERLSGNGRDSQTPTQSQVQKARGGIDGKRGRHVNYFRQNAVKLKTPVDKGKSEQPEHVQRILGKIF